MGYYQNEEVAGQTEESHRPKPVTVHVAWPTRKLERSIERANKSTQLRANLKQVAWVAGFTVAGGVALGFGLGAMAGAL